MRLQYLMIISLFLLCCSPNQAGRKDNVVIIKKTGLDIATRFSVPKDFKRVHTDPQSFGAYLRLLPLKPDGAKVKLFDGQLKENDVYEAVVDMEIGNTDLQQCADAVMRLRGEYLYKQGRYNDISFDFNNGFACDYKHWMGGYRVKIKGNNAEWVKTAQPLNNHQNFRKYMDLVFSYAGTLGLAKMLKPKNIDNMQTGDVFIKGGSPGHAVIVADMAEDSAGHKIFILAQSYMPAQDIQILKNENNPETSPWYYVSEIKDILVTPEWIFSKDQLKGW